MAMIVQHNMTAMNANRQLGISTSALAKSTEKLSSGYRINRAADDAAGLAISEKMRSQIRGLDQASTNASDGISMIQTAEGALNESHSILQRMRELAVQAANGTETDEDRGNIQDEIEQLQEELDRIAEDTEFNQMKLLDGSLSSGNTNITGAGPKYGEYDGQLGAFITSDVAGVVVKANTSATAGGESAIWESDGKTLNLNLAQNVTYSQAEIDKLIEEAKQEDSGAVNSPANVTVKFANSIYTAKDVTEGVPTVAGKKASTKPELSYTKALTANASLSNDTITANAKSTGYSVKLSAAGNTTTDSAVTVNNKEITITIGTDEMTAEQINALIAEQLGNSDVTVVFDGTVKSTNATAAAVTGNAENIDGVVADSYTAYNATIATEVETDTAGVTVTFDVETGKAGNETAAWNAAGRTLTLTLDDAKSYTQAEIDELIKNATAPTNAGVTAPEVSVTLNNGTFTSATDVTMTPNTPKMDDGVKLTEDTAKYYGANTINISSNRYGADQNVSIVIDFNAKEGQEEAEPIALPTHDMSQNGSANAVTNAGTFALSLQAGKEYTAEDIEKILGQAGLDMTVTLSGNEKNNGTDEPNILMITDKNITATLNLKGGAGIGDEDAFLTQTNYGTSAGFGGVILQVGANEGQTLSFSIDDMSASSLGVNGSKVDVSTQTGASSSLGRIDEAIQKVSKQRSLLGAVQNRLEHTIANLDNTAENLQAAESGIRDVDMAEEMVTMSKYNILQQAGQSMLAQANQATQGVLSLLQG